MDSCRLIDGLSTLVSKGKSSVVGSATGACPSSSYSSAPAVTEPGGVKWVATKRLLILPGELREGRALIPPRALGPWFPRYARLQPPPLGRPRPLGLGGPQQAPVLRRQLTKTMRRLLVGAEG